MQSLESLLQVQMTQQVIKLLNSMQAVTIEGLSLNANLKTRVQVVSNSAQENQNSAKQNQGQNQSNQANQANQTGQKNQTNQAKTNLQNQANQTNSAKAPVANLPSTDSKSAINAQTYKVVLKLMDGRNISVNLPKPLPVGAKLELIMKSNSSGVLRPLASATKSVINQPASLNAKNSLNQAQLQNILNQSLTKALPKQMPLNQVLKQLDANLPKITTRTNLPLDDKINIRQSVQKILDHFPKKNNSPPNSADIKRAIKTNGVLFEANLAKIAAMTSTNASLTNISNQAAMVNVDLKFLLQRASILLQNALLSASAKSANAGSQTSQATNTAPQPFGASSQSGGQAGLGHLVQGGQAQAGQSASANQAMQGGQGQAQGQTQAQAQAQAQASGSSEVLQQVGKLLDSAMAKIQTQQHSALQQTNIGDNRGVTQNLQVSIPFFANGTWQNIDLELNKLDEDSSGSGDGSGDRDAKVWQVTLNFSLADWGKISTRLVLRGESLRADLWLETKEKQEKMQIASESLAARLRSIGADVEKITCHIGGIKTKEAVPSSDKLIDTRV